MSPQPISVGIVGLGKSGWDIHVKALKDRSDFHIAAVTDPMPERRKEARDVLQCRVYDEPGELFRDTDVELVVIASPSHTHGAFALQALEAGKHVLVEKPMATHLGEAEQMIEAANRHGRVLTSYQVRRLDADFLMAKEVIASGKLGPIAMIRMTRHSYNRRRDWQTLRKFGGGMLNNWGSHILDMALQLMGGEYESFFADMRNIVSAGDAEDHLKVVLKGRDMVVDVEIMSSVAYPAPHWFVVGKYGTMVGGSQQFRIKYYDPADVPPLLPPEEVSKTREYGHEDLPWKEEVVPIRSKKPESTVFYDKLYDSLRHGKALFVTPESVKTLIGLFDAVREATGFA